MNNIGNLIRKDRIQKGLSQDELAKKLGYKSRSSINKIELGLQDIPKNKVSSFARILSIQPESLINWNETFNETNRRIEKTINDKLSFSNFIESIGWNISQSCIQTKEHHLGNYNDGSPVMYEECTYEYKLSKDGLSVTLSQDEYDKLLETQKNNLNDELLNIAKKRIGYI